MRRWCLIWLTMSLLVLRSVLGALGVGPKPDDNDGEIAGRGHQLAIVQRQGPRRRYHDTDRRLLSMLAWLLPREHRGVFLGVCCVGTGPEACGRRGALSQRERPDGSHGDHELLECGRDPVLFVDVDGEFVVASPDVLDEGVAGGDGDGRSGSFQAPHRPEPGFEPGMIGFAPVVGVTVRDVAGVG
jgi:hypothetical protein